MGYRRSQLGPVAVAGLTLNGTTVVRRLALMGYDVWALSHNPDEQGWHGRYGHKLRVPDPRDGGPAWRTFMREWASGFPDKVPVLPMSDVFVVAFDEAAANPDWPFPLHGLGSGLRTALTSKRGTFDLAANHAFPSPLTRWIQGRDELAAFAEEIGGEVLFKPEFSPAWRTEPARDAARDRKVVQGRTVDDLLQGYDEMAPFTPEVLAQEVIPGPDESLVYWCGFIGPGGEPGGSLVGRKWRVTPIHFGSASFVELIDAPAIEEQCLRFLSDLGYQGICGIEMKEDPRDGVAKLIEVNPRYGLWDDIGVPAGVDLAREAVESLRGAPTEARRPSRFGIRWLSVDRDASAFAQYHREGSLSLPRWIWSLRPPLYVNDLPVWRDPRYALYTLTHGFRKMRTKQRKRRSGSG